ncbi:DgyrCDS154 [Dimorphilus gyrociliatus]|uniref:DgyrCDS154 n=1 Tax=Dimorphilus gyrociliatus TaxID=2664684 RepID=A0A7I8V514_9ANNE|nr:DgyrCDS154 [Dimorphilus gyrociliatus]
MENWEETLSIESFENRITTCESTIRNINEQFSKDAIDCWKILQRRAQLDSGLVKNWSRNTELLQKLDNKIYDFLSITKSILQRIVLERENDHSVQLEHIYHHYISLIRDFIENWALIIDNQPTQEFEQKSQQVFKVEQNKIKNFKMTARLLGKNSYFQISTLKIKAIYDKDFHNRNEDDIKQFCHMGKTEFESKFNRQGTRSWTITKVPITNVMQHEKSDRNDYIREKKYFFTLRIECKLDCLKNTPTFTAQEISLPVSLITHVNQTVDAYGTIYWFNLFANNQRGLVTDNILPKEVPWLCLEKFLTTKWNKQMADSAKDFNKFKASASKTLDQRPLRVDDLTYLASRAMRSNKKDFYHQDLTWSQFSKEKLVPNSTFSFWKYFFACMTSACINKDEWLKGYIYGFATTEEVEQRLSKEDTGAFVIRFSESTISKNQSKNISGELILEVVYLTSSGKKIILKSKELIKPENLKAGGLVPTLLSFEYFCRRTNTKRPFLTKLIKKDGDAIELSEIASNLKSEVPFCPLKILVDTHKAEFIVSSRSLNYREDFTVPDLLGKDEVNEILEELELDIGPSKYGKMPAEFANMDPDIFQEKTSPIFSIENWHTTAAKELYEQLVYAGKTNDIDSKNFLDDIKQNNEPVKAEYYVNNNNNSNNELNSIPNQLHPYLFSSEHEQMDFTPFC